MRTSIRLAAVALVVAIGLTASGCATDDPAPKPSTSTSAAPLFASDEEALAAAEEAYAAYLFTTDQVLADGGIGAERLSAVASEPQLGADRLSAADTASMGYKLVGQSNFDGMTLQQTSDSDLARAVVVYACQDISGVDVLDASGRSIVSPDRQDRILYEVAFAAETTDDKTMLRVSNQTPWGDGSC